MLVAYGLSRFPRPAVWTTGLMLVLFPFLSDTSDWIYWFDWVKRYSVVIPAFTWAFLHDRPNHRFSRVLAVVLPWVLILNVLEAGLLELLGPNPLNGVLIVIVGVCVPYKWTQDGAQRQLGFRNPLWQVAYFMTLLRLYVLHPQFENGTAGAVIVVTLASLLCLVERDSQNYVCLRLYTLYFFVLQDSFFPNFSEHLYPVWLHAENRVLLQGTPFANLWLVLNAALVVALVVQRVRAWPAKSPTAAVV